MHHEAHLLRRAELCLVPREEKLLPIQRLPICGIQAEAARGGRHIPDQYTWANAARCGARRQRVVVHEHHARGHHLSDLCRPETRSSGRTAGEAEHLNPAEAPSGRSAPPATAQLTQAKRPARFSIWQPASATAATRPSALPAAVAASTATTIATEAASATITAAAATTFTTSTPTAVSTTTMAT